MVVEHCDGIYETPDGSERSYYTVHLYLNESTKSEPLKGGATRFHSRDMRKHYDVDPKVGRVLVFQHNYLLHSGADVKEGFKYTMRTDIMFKQE
jgi:hypothetical protein